MQAHYFTSKYQTHSQAMITLNRQIQALSPIRISYENLSKYHNKIAYDLQSLIQQHDFAISSLKSNLQNLLMIANRTEQQKNFVLEKLNDLENQCDKVLFDTKNLAQKVQSLGKKLKLEVSQNESNLSYKGELENIFNSLKNHIQALENLNSDLRLQQDHLQAQLIKIDTESNDQRQKNNQLTQKINECKSSIASLNIKNDDLIDINNRLSQQINLKEQAFNASNKLNRQLKQHLIELTSDFQRLKNQIQYKNSLLSAQKTAEVQMQSHEQSLSKTICSLSEERAKVYEENLRQQTEVVEQSNNKQTNLKFKQNSEKHLAELKRQNQVLLQKMEQCCVQDREIQALLLKKMSTLEAFSRRLNKQYEFDSHLTSNLLKQKSVIFNERSFNTHLSHRITQKSEKLNYTRASSKSPWMKENFA